MSNIVKLLKYIFRCGQNRVIPTTLNVCSTSKKFMLFLKLNFLHCHTQQFCHISFQHSSRSVETSMQLSDIFAKILLQRASLMLQVKITIWRQVTDIQVAQNSNIISQFFFYHNLLLQLI